MLWIPGVVFVGIALIGLLPALLMPKLKSYDQSLPIDFNPFRPYVQALREMSKSSLLLVALAWSFFYLIGMMALLVLPDFSGLLKISQDNDGYYRANELYQEMELVLEATCTACAAGR